jgi:lipopolysaccharide transport system permease protein
MVPRMIAHLSAVWQFRYFWLSLVRLDLQNRYRRSVLGIGWSMLHPLAMTVVFCVAFGGILGTSDWREYAPFLLAGMVVWDFVKGSALQGCESFIRAEAYIRQCPLPYSIYPLRTVLGTFIHFAIGLAMLACVIAVIRESTAVFSSFVLVLPAILMVTVFAWSIATMTAFIQVYFHDTKHLIEVGSQMFFFLTPIMYAREKLDKQGLGWLADMNPVTLFLELIRTPLVLNVAPTWDLYTQGMILTLTTFGLACGTIAWLQKKVIFQL